MSKRDALADQVLSGKGEPYDLSFGKGDTKSFVFVVDPSGVDAFVSQPPGFQSQAVVQSEPSPADGLLPVAKYFGSADSPSCTIVVLRLADPSRYPDKLPDEVKRSEKTLVHVRFEC